MRQAFLAGVIVGMLIVGLLNLALEEEDEPTSMTYLSDETQICGDASVWGLCPLAEQTSAYFLPEGEGSITCTVTPWEEIDD